MRAEWIHGLRRELSEHRIAYGVAALFVVGTPFAIPFLFPEASLGMGIFGGIVLGVFFALFAVPGKFLSD